MKTMIITGTMALFVAVIIGTTMGQDSLLQAFSSSDISMQVIRLLSIGFLASLLLTSPPRGKYFRAALFSAAVALGIGAMVLAVKYAMGVLDAVLLAEVAIILAIEAVEEPIVALKSPKKSSRNYVKQAKA